MYNPYRIGCLYWWKFWLNLPRNIIHFFKRLRTYAPVLFNSCRCCDQSTLQLMKVRFYEHARSFETANTKHVGHERDLQRIKLCSELLKRICADEYGMGLENYKPTLYIHKDWYGEYMARQDMNMLCDTMKKYLRHWWI